MFLRARLLYYICNLFWAASVLSNQIILHGSNAGDRTLEEGLGTVIKLSDRYYYLPKRVSVRYENDLIGLPTDRLRYRHRII